MRVFLIWFILISSALAAPALQGPSPEHWDGQSAGWGEIAVILVQTQDRLGVRDSQFLDSLVFQAAGQYFLTQGGPQLFGSTHPWVTVPGLYEDYVGRYYGLDGGARRMVEEALRLLPSLPTRLVVIHPGKGAEASSDTSDIWSHASGVGIYSYTVQGEYVRDTTSREGIICHELGHMLWSLPDLYDLDHSSSGLGGWCLMSLGSWQVPPSSMSSYCKARAGMILPEIVGTGTHLVEGILKIPRDGLTYYLMEYRTEGILVWRVDESKSNNTKEWYPGGPNLGNYLVSLIQADGEYDLERRKNQGDPQDAFPGPGVPYGVFHHEDSWYGEPSSLKFDVLDSNTVYLDLVGTEVNLEENTGNIPNYPEILGIYNILGQRVIPRNSGVYFERCKAGSLIFYRKLVLVR